MIQPRPEHASDAEEKAAAPGASPSAEDGTALPTDGGDGGDGGGGGSRGGAGGAAAAGAGGDDLESKATEAEGVEGAKEAEEAEVPAIEGRAIMFVMGGVNFQSDLGDLVAIDVTNVPKAADEETDDSGATA